MRSGVPSQEGEKATVVKGFIVTAFVILTFLQVSVCLSDFSSESFRPHQGCYGRVTRDALFKHVMQSETVRNAFLSVVLNETVLNSTSLHGSLNPWKEYASLHKVIDKHKKFMRKIRSRPSRIKVANSTSGRRLRSGERCLRDLAFHYNQLLHVIPAPERNTHLNVVTLTLTLTLTLVLFQQPQSRCLIQQLTQTMSP